MLFNIRALPAERAPAYEAPRRNPHVSPGAVWAGAEAAAPRRHEAPANPRPRAANPGKTAGCGGGQERCPAVSLANAAAYPTSRLCVIGGGGAARRLDAHGLPAQGRVDMLPAVIPSCVPSTQERSPGLWLRRLVTPTSSLPWPQGVRPSNATRVRLGVLCLEPGHICGSAPVDSDVFHCPPPCPLLQVWVIDGGRLLRRARMVSGERV
jgi:hypothetical protein